MSVSIVVHLLPKCHEKKKKFSLLLIKNCCFVHPAKLFPSSSRVCSVSNSNEDDSKEAEEENRQP